jgi:structure-specific recognition protein 1
MKDYVPPSDDELVAKGSKKKSDPNAPKGKKSAYIFFCSENRDAAKTEIGKEGKATDVTKLLATWWNELKADEDRSEELEKYTKMASDDKARHDQETQEYAPPSDDEKVVAKKSGGKKKSDPNAPKGKKSAYIFFCSDNRDAAKTEIGTDGKARDVTKLLATWWNELKADNDRSDELEKYTKMAADDKNRYEKETSGVAAPQSDDEETPESKKVKSKKSKASNDEGKNDEGKNDKGSEPKKGKSKKINSDDKPQSGKKMNGYTHFCSLNRASVKEDNPEMSATEITKELARQWKELDEDEQNEWKEAVTTV